MFPDQKMSQNEVMLLIKMENINYLHHNIPVQ